jgi:uncharacterized YccA/Bax inhibitor family protein
MAFRSSNPVFTNRNYVPSPGQLSEMYAAPTRLTVDDVVIHTGGMLGLVAVGGAFGWALSSNGNLGLALAAALVALGMSWFVAPKLARAGRFGASFAIPFSLIEGVFVGSISKAYDDRFSGIVGQALIGTGAVFLVMLVLHRTGKLRATPKMQRIVFGGLMAVVVVSLVDLLLGTLTSYQLPFFTGSGPISILITLGILVLASLQFTLDFGYVENAIAQGAPTKTAWLLSYGLVVSFVWVYLELLRLLSQLRR